MTESVSSDFIRQVRLALEVLAGGTSISPTDELSTLIGGRGFIHAPKGTDQVSSFSANEHIEWDDVSPVWVSDGDITVSTGAGQLAGLITLPAGRAWLCMARLGVRFSGSAGELGYRWQRVSPSPSGAFGNGATVRPDSNGLNINLNPIASGIIDLRSEPDLADVVVRVETSVSSAVNQVDRSNAGGTFMSIHAL